MQSGAVSKSGFRYVYYGCPRHRDGSCKNGRSYREDQLRDAVVSRARSRLFPAPGSPGSAPGWLPELLDWVRADLGRQRSSAPERAAESARESAELRRDLEGWGTTLGNPKLAASVREDIELKYAAAKARISELERAVAEDRALADHVERVLDGAEVVARLGRLSEALAMANPTLGNLELGRHIERIDCHADGVVELRGTYLGLFDGGVELLSQVVPAPAPAPAVPAADDGLAAGFAPAVPRRRARLRVPNLSAEGASTAGEVDTSLDPSRFAGLPSAFFWTESFVLSGRSCWAEENAEAVLAARAGGSTMEELAARFGKSRPTIRHALKIAAARRPAAGTDDEASSGEDESAA